MIYMFLKRLIGASFLFSFAMIYSSEDRVREKLQEKQAVQQAQAVDSTLITIQNVDGTASMTLNRDIALKFPFLKAFVENNERESKALQYTLEFNYENQTLIVLRELLIILAQENCHALHACTYLQKHMSVSDSQLDLTELLEIGLQWNISEIVDGIIRFLHVDQEAVALFEKFAAHIPAAHFLVLLKNPNNCGFVVKCLLYKMQHVPAQLTDKDLVDIITSLASVVRDTVLFDADLHEILLSDDLSCAPYILGKKLIELFKDPLLQNSSNKRLAQLLAQHYFFMLNDNSRRTFGVELPKEFTVRKLMCGDRYYVLRGTMPDGDFSEISHVIVNRKSQEIAHHITDGSRLRPFNDNRILAYSNDNVEIFNVETRKLLSSLPLEHINAAEIMDDDRIIVSSKFGLAAHDIKSERGSIHVLDDKLTDATRIVVKGNHIVAASADICKIWRRDTLALIKTLTKPAGSHNELSNFFVDLNHLIIVNEENAVVIDLATFKETVIQLREIKKACMLSHEGNLYLAALCKDNLVHLWNVSLNKRHRKLVCLKNSAMDVFTENNKLRVLYGDGIIDDIYPQSLFNDLQNLDLITMLEHFAYIGSELLINNIEQILNPPSAQP